MMRGMRLGLWGDGCVKLGDDCIAYIFIDCLR